MNYLDPLINQKSKSQFMVPSGYWRTDVVPLILCKLNGGCEANFSTTSAFYGMKINALYSDSDEILVPISTAKFGYVNEKGEEIIAEQLDEFKILGLNRIKQQGNYKAYQFDGFFAQFFCKGAC
ncbi:Palmitoyl-protein_thioesterase [Hexamita inflata]|uniref:Palmitoyl-protein thioesterase n=1 Tax=Hexamita inflata TaxID=28002 RepID=A0AA86RRP5_9EUKA|nr:Palmitoyl-protein thioesterase [Hexamita inflata]CAI9976802.1 Palmitoyl-protein thioesterase [Hexamita inflata]